MSFFSSLLVNVQYEDATLLKWLDYFKAQVGA